MKNIIYKLRILLAVIIFIFAIAGIYSIFYPVKIFDWQLSPLLGRLLTDFSITAAVILAVIIIFTLLFGRLYCSLICPAGIFQELITLITKKDSEKQKSYPFKYFIAAVSFGILIGGSTIIIRFIDPYSIFGSALTLSVTGIIAILIIGFITFFKNRFFCTNICPVGALLGLLSKFSLFKMYIDKNECLSCGMCERSCPAGCIDIDEQSINNETCIKCLKCPDICAKDAIKYGIKPKEQIKFNIKRRELIVSSAVLILLAGCVKAGIEITKNTALKLKDIILPPGGINENRMLSKCLNCNLCVNACPNKIIKKANKNFAAVHIEYGEHKGFCKYDCNECSNVCPSGAIKKISKQEKQRTMIAKAIVNKEKCTACGKCIRKCPLNIISVNEDKTALIDSAKCIGCGACINTCHFDAIQIFAVREQKVL